MTAMYLFICSDFVVFTGQAFNGPESEWGCFFYVFVNYFRCCIYRRNFWVLTALKADGNHFQWINSHSVEVGLKSLFRETQQRSRKSVFWFFKALALRPLCSEHNNAGYSSPLKRETKVSEFFDTFQGFITAKDICGLWCEEGLEDRGKGNKSW